MGRKFGVILLTAALAIAALNPAQGAGSSAATSKKYPKSLDKCVQGNEWVIGYGAHKTLVYLSCGPDGRLHPEQGAAKIDQKTGKPIIGPLGDTNFTIEYVNPPTITTKPKTELSSFDANLEPCKIADAGPLGDIQNNRQHHFTVGFPLYPERAKLDEKLVVQFVPVDFADVKGKHSPAVDWAETKKYLAKFWQLQGTKEINLDIRIPGEYTHLPQKVLYYDIATEFAKTGRPPLGTFSYARDAIAAIDSKIDFSDVDVIAVVPPAEATKKQVASFTAEAAEPGRGFKTKEKEIMNLLVSPNKPKSAFDFLSWAHEFGHMLGLSDIRNVRSASDQDSSPLGVIDLMNSMVAPELLGWQRFLLGTIYDNQVNCLSKAGTYTSWITPIEARDKGVKVAVIPTGKYTAIAIESRRSYGFDSNLGSANRGLFVYQIDTTIPYGLSPIKVAPSPTAKDNQLRRDAALKQGESVAVDGVTITNVESGAFGDVAKIVRN